MTNSFVKQAADEGWPKKLKKGRFTEYCKRNGFDGPCKACADKALKSDDASVRGMASFYINTTLKKKKSNSEENIKEAQDVLTPETEDAFVDSFDANQRRKRRLELTPSNRPRVRRQDMRRELEQVDPNMSDNAFNRFLDTKEKQLDEKQNMPDDDFLALVRKHLNAISKTWIITAKTN